MNGIDKKINFLKKNGYFFICANKRFLITWDYFVRNIIN